MRDETNHRAQDAQEKLVSDENDFDAKKFSDTLHDQIHRDIHSEVNEQMDPDGKRRNPIVGGIHIGRRGSSGLFWGAFLVLGGVALLLDHMGYVSVDRLWRFWPLLLVCAGIPNIMRREHRLWGILLITGGVLFQLNELGLAHFRWNDIWPSEATRGRLSVKRPSSAVWSAGSPVRTFKAGTLAPSSAASKSI